MHLHEVKHQSANFLPYLNKTLEGSWIYFISPGIGINLAQKLLA